MGWFPLLDQITALNNIYNYVVNGGLVTDFVGIILGIVYIMMYPFNVILNVIYEDVSYVYSIMIVPINAVLDLPSLFLELTSFLPTHTPPVWLQILELAVLLNVSFKVAVIANYAYEVWKKLRPA